MQTLLRAPTREVRAGTLDSTRWASYTPRPDDIVIATYPKCGTTWMQRIVDLLVFGNGEPRQFLEASPWIDATIFGPLEAQIATIEAQTHRRFVKSHLPFDALPVYEGVKYIHVARDGRDAALSMHNHQVGFKQDFAAEIAEREGRPPATSEDPREFVLEWLAAHEQGEADAEDFFLFENTYWERRGDANLLMVHYADLKADLVGEMVRVAAFLDIDVTRASVAELAIHAEFDRMKRDGDVTMPQLRMAFDRGADRFINKGENGRWRAVFADEDLARYDALVKARFAPACARWVESGRLEAGDPRGLIDRPQH